MRFTNQSVIVTGSGRGIGAAIAKAFHREGAKVVLVSRTQSEISHVEAELLAQESKSLSAESRPHISADHGSSRVATFCGDCSQELHVQALFEFAQRRFGSVDILVNNAGYILPCKIEEMTFESFRRQMDVNVGSVFLCSREAFRIMKRSSSERPDRNERNNSRCILNVSSLAGLQGTEKFSGFSAYTAGKMGVTGLTECLAVEGRPYQIRVNAIAPGAVDTRMLREALPFITPVAVPEDIVPTVLFLCDPTQSKMLTGAVIPIHTPIGSEGSGGH